MGPEDINGDKPKLGRSMYWRICDEIAELRNYFKMKTSLVLLLISYFAAQGQNLEPKPEAKLEGTWVVKKLSVRGKEIQDLGEKSVVVLSNGSMAMRLMGTQIDLGKFTIDLSKKPSEMDIIRQEGDQKGMTVQAIFSLEGNNLRICLGESPAVTRPTEFKVKEGQRLISMELKREDK